jgi:hypothetical protein
MVSFPRLAQSYLWPLFVFIAANLLLLAQRGPALTYLAALVLLAFLPGWIWLGVFFEQPVECGERLALAVGLSLALTIFSMMGVVYWPGSLRATPVLIVINVTILVGLAALWRRAGAVSAPACSPALLWAMLLLLLLAAALRLPRLGYAEFHEDEAEALMLGVRLLQGEDYALFLHRKGPAQMLLPVAFWLLTGQIDESLARFPFALSSLLSVITLFFIGRRWFNWQAGLIAALLWAINGYAIGFGRMVQYQALIFFLGPLAIYCLYWAWKAGQGRWQILGAIFLATCLLAHFDALLLLPAAAYLSWKNLTPHPPSLRGKGEQELPTLRGKGEQELLAPQGKGEQELLTLRRKGEQKLPSLIGEGLGEGSAHSRLITTILTLLLFLALLASFYVPYVLDPEFKNTTAYLSETRVKPGLLYNNLDLLRRFDRDYSSHFYLPLLVIGMIIYTGWQSRNLQKKRQWLLAGLFLLLASTFWFPEQWQVGQLNLAMIPWLLAGTICFWVAPNVEARTAWMVFGAALLGYVFLVSDPRTHLYILYPGAVLLAGAGWAVALAQPIGRYFVLSLGGVLVGAIILYEAAIFLPTESAFSHLRETWDGSGWEMIYNDIPQAREYFGYPKKEGWKATGALRAQGLFPGDFRSVNEDFIIPIWYNYGQPRSCYETPAHFFVRAAGGDVMTPPGDQSYAETAQISREREIRLRVFSANITTDAAPDVYPVEAIEENFDRLATPGQFAQQAEPDQVVGTQFGTAITFVGYDLLTPVVAAGETLYLNLYWRALKPPQDRYRAFVHLTDGATLWGQQDDDPACRLPTSIWRTGQRGVGQFRLPIDPETPPGRYPLIIGLYQAETLERLKITAGTGKIGDDFLWLGDVEIKSAMNGE